MTLRVPEEGNEPFITALAHGVPFLQNLDVGILKRLRFSLPLSMETTPRFSSLTCHISSLIPPSRLLTQMRYLKTAGDIQSLQSLINWLKHSPALEQLSYRSLPLSPGRNSIISGIEIEMPSLHTLKLDSIESPSMQAQVLVDQLRVPSLRSLTLFRLDPDFFPHLHNLLRRSSPSFKSLIIKHSRLGSPDILTAILSIAPTLQELSLDRNIDNRFIEALTLRPSSHTERTMNASLCPKLRRIEFWVTKSVSDAALVGMIASRCENGDPGLGNSFRGLEKVVIFDYDNAFSALQDHPTIVNCVLLHGLRYEVCFILSLEY